MTNPPIGTPASQQGASSQAIVALIVGLLGLLTCPILSPVAWYLGSQELKAIRAGRSPAAGEGLAKVGWVLGIVGTVLLSLGLVFLFFFGGLTILGAWWGAQGG